MSNVTFNNYTLQKPYVGFGRIYRSSNISNGTLETNIDDVEPIVNAVEIDWNGAELTNIGTTIQ